MGVLNSLNIVANENTQNVPNQYLVCWITFRFGSKIKDKIEGSIAEWFLEFLKADYDAEKKY